MHGNIRTFWELEARGVQGTFDSIESGMAKLSQTIFRYATCHCKFPFAVSPDDDFHNSIQPRAIHKFYSMMMTSTKFLYSTFHDLNWFIPQNPFWWLLPLAVSLRWTSYVQAWSLKGPASIRVLSHPPPPKECTIFHPSSKKLGRALWSVSV